MDLYSINNVLENYLPAMSHHLNNCTLLLSLIEKCNNKVYGDQIINIAKTHKEDNFCEKFSLKTVYRRLELSKRAIRLSSAGALVILINSEMRSLVDKVAHVVNKESISDLNKIFNSDFIVKYKLSNASNKDIFNTLLNCIYNHSDISNLIMCSSKIRRIIVDHLVEIGERPEYREIHGFNCLIIGGIPLIIDKFMDDDKIYVIDTNSLELQQLADWEWLKDSNNILKEYDFNDNCVVAATLIKYYRIICRDYTKQFCIQLEQDTIQGNNNE